MKHRPFALLIAALVVALLAPACGGGGAGGPPGCADGGCGNGDSCAGVVCDTPPAAVCASATTLTVYTSPGVCAAGQCSYASRSTACAQGCRDGACLGDPCVGVTCDDPPGPCFAAVGSCQSGVCHYPGLDGTPCDDGDPCTTGDTCGAGGAASCAGASRECQTPPAATCASATVLTVYAPTGGCDGAGGCAYASTQVVCPGGCAGGACQGDACVGVTCATPPSGCHQATGACANGACGYELDNGASCDDGDACTTGDACMNGVCGGTRVACTTPDPPACVDATTLRAFVSPGQCGGAGLCTYAPAEVSCAYGCVGGACVGDPCAGVSCATPDPPRCTSATVLQTFAAAGLCSGGACSYAPTLTTCRYGCAQNACQPPAGLVISEVLFNSEGYPDTESFVELHGPPGLPVDGLTLVGVNGNGGRDYATITLAGSLGADGLFVVAHPAATGATAPAADLLAAAVDFQNGPDSIQLRFGALVLDAVAYGAFASGDVAAGEGNPAEIPPVGQSLHRDASYTDTDDNATDFAVGLPTPGHGHVDTSCDTVLNPGCDCLNGTTRACGTDVGACDFGTETCAGGHWGQCQGGVTPVTEVCGNAVDDNCDGTTDEGCGPENPFTAGICSGTALTASTAMTLLGGAARKTLASATIQIRNRSCTTCTWGDPVAWVISYLTYSGGVTTRYQNLTATMNLVLFLDAGAPKLSLQHTTFAGSTYGDTDGMVYGFPPQVIQYPHIRAYNHAPASQYDYLELDYMAVNGTVVLGDGCLQWTADAYGQGGPPYTQGYAVVFRWD